MVDLNQWRVAQAIQYYQIIVSYFPLLGDYVKDYTNLLSAADFESIYSLKMALRQIFPSMKELSEENIKTINEKLEDVFANFLAGVVVYKQEEMLPQKRRGRKPKSWYEDQEKFKREKRERKERGEIVSSDDEDEEDSPDEYEFHGISKKVDDDTGKEGIEGVDGEGNAFDEDLQEEGNSESSVVIRRRGRPPKRQAYTGKKRGRKPKNSLGSRQDKEYDWDSKVSELERKEEIDQSQLQEDRGIYEESDLQNQQQQQEISKSIEDRRQARRQRISMDDEEEHIENGDEDDEDYGGTSSIRKTTPCRRGRPPKGKTSVVCRRGRKPNVRKDDVSKQDIGMEVEEEYKINVDKQGEDDKQNNNNIGVYEGEDIQVEQPRVAKRGRPRKVDQLQSVIKKQLQLQDEGEAENTIAQVEGEERLKQTIAPTIALRTRNPRGRPKGTLSSQAIESTGEDQIEVKPIKLLSPMPKFKDDNDNVEEEDEEEIGKTFIRNCSKQRKIDDDASGGQFNKNDGNESDNESEEERQDRMREEDDDDEDEEQSKEQQENSSDEDDSNEKDIKEDDEQSEGDEEGLANVRTRRSQKIQSNDSSSQIIKGVNKSKRITKDKNSYTDPDDLPKRKGRPPKKMILRGRNKL